MRNEKEAIDYIKRQLQAVIGFYSFNVIECAKRDGTIWFVHFSTRSTDSNEIRFTAVLEDYSLYVMYYDEEFNRIRNLSSYLLSQLAV